MNFTEKLLAATRQHRSLLCVGLDPEPGLLPPSLVNLPLDEAITRFCCEIIEATAPFVCAFKPNLAFFEALGPKGMMALQKILKAIPAHIPTIADAKRGDIGNSTRHYASAIFDIYGFDACTVNPYLGLDSVAPFLAYQEKGIIILCRTSNAGARDFQDLLVQGSDGQSYPLYEMVAQRVLAWNQFGNCGLVVGATYPQELATIRALCPALPILIPGVGAQGGDLAAAVRAGVDANGERAIISVSRAILYADSGPHFANAAKAQARHLHNQIRQALKNL
jgi:orotidine-5'-phosphate decarboxylase